MPGRAGQLDLTFRDANEGDVGQLAELFAADMADLGEDTPLGELRTVTRRMVDGSHPHHHVRVAEHDGRLAGCVVANEFLSVKFPGRALWIEELYVSPEFRRRGIGRRLVEELLAWAWEVGFQGIDLEAYRMNTAASILYRSLGFRRLARERYSFDMIRFPEEFVLEGEEDE